MKKQDSVTYLAIFSKESDGGYSIDVPAIEGAYTCSDTFEEGIANAQEVIGLCLYDEENEKIEYPDDIDMDELDFEEGDLAVYVNVYLPYQFSLVKEVYKNKMVTLPTWLEALAKNKNINFSRVLTEGLKKELNIK